MDYVYNMVADDFHKSYNYIEILASQEQLRDFETVSYPHNSAKNRKSIFKRVKNTAVPIELNTQEVLSVKEASEKMKRIMNV